MRLALISDIHGNLEALEAVLRDVAGQKADQVHCLGDVVGYGCDPVACLHLVGDSCDIKLMGNHEYAAIGVLPTGAMNPTARQSMIWTMAQLTDREISLISGFEMTAERENCLLVHASPFDPDEWHYILSPQDAVEAFAHSEHRLIFHGHTHLPVIYCRPPVGKVRTITAHDFDPDENSRYLVNIGSVGQPRDNDPRACYVIYDSSEDTVYFRRVEYDIQAAQAKMCRADMPQMLIDRLQVGR
ncbi:MAG: metallophosphoesterase family protein [Candidatus Zixiibacteriota bacterium]